MNTKHIFFAAGLAIVAGVAGLAYAAGEMVEFPAAYDQGVHYATIHRGNVREELFTSPEAIAAAKAGQPLPAGTVITMEDYRGDALYRYVVMEKRPGWGVEHPPALRTGEWEFQWFNPDRTVNAGENLDRCRSCHVSQSSQDFLFTTGQMKSAN